MDLAVNTLLTHTPSDQLRVLRSEIENDDCFVLQLKRSNYERTSLIGSLPNCVKKVIIRPPFEMSE